MPHQTKPHHYIRIIALKNEMITDNMFPLLKTVMENGRQTKLTPSLNQIRNFFARRFHAWMM
jgi:hypothetical protein